MDNNASHQVDARDQTILHVESNVMLSTDLVLSITEKSEGLTSPTLQKIFRCFQIQFLSNKLD